MDIWSFFSITSKLMFYIGALFASGTVFYSIFFETSKAKSSFPGRRITGLFAVAGLVAAAAGYAAAAASLTGEAASVFDGEMLGILWQTPVGTVLVLRVLGLLLILVGLFTGRPGKSITAIGCLIVLGAFTQIGHVTEVSNFFFRFFLLIHLVGIALWAGILLPLYQLSSNPSMIAATGEIAHRFGRSAAIFVPTLLIAGGWFACQLVGSFQNLFATGYGQTLLVKVATVAGLLGLAAANKLRFVPALRAGDASALKHFNQSVRIEILLVVLVLSITAVLTSVLTLPEIHS